MEATNQHQTARRWPIGLLLAIFAVLPLQAQTFTVLHEFTFQPDGANPFGGLTADRAGNLYGATEVGGQFNGGTVFKLTHRGSGWVFSVLYAFNHDAYLPASKVVFGPDGALYGTTTAGGIGDCQGNGWSGCGTVFSLQPPPTFCASISCPWTKTTLYRFTGYTDAANPNSEVVFDAAGSIYGTTTFGGGINCRENDNRGCGALYKLTRAGSSWTESVIHSFSWGDGLWPGSAPTLDQNGNLYGTASYGGVPCADSQFGCGTIWEWMPAGPGFTVLHTFQGGSDGAYPFGSLIFDHTGRLYGSTWFMTGGPHCGTVFELDPPYGTYSIDYNFACQGEGPGGTLILDSAGNLYGARTTGGLYGYGAVFRLMPSIGGWTYTSLRDFDFSDGSQAFGSVVLDGNGNLYGTTFAGGTNDDCLYQGGSCGVVWEVSP